MRLSTRGRKKKKKKKKRNITKYTVRRKAPAPDKGCKGKKKHLGQHFFLKKMRLLRRPKLGNPLR